MSELHPTEASDYRKSPECIETNARKLVENYVQKAEQERTKFEDDSYDSDIVAMWSSKEMDEARRNYERYVAIAREIAALLR